MGECEGPEVRTEKPRPPYDVKIHGDKVRRGTTDEAASKPARQLHTAPGNILPHMAIHPAQSFPSQIRHLGIPRPSALLLAQ